MRKVSLIPIAMATCGLFAFSAGAQETGKAAKAAASTTPTIDQSIEWKNAFSPKLSPDGKRVVYEVQKANWEENAFDRNLWIADIATGESHALTSAKKTSTNAAWSPDGTRIAFSAQKDSDLISSFSEDIYVVKIADKSVKKIVDTPGPDSNPKWSPDGKKIAFETAAGAKFFYYTNAKIAVVPAEGGTPQILTEAFDEDPGLVGWGPDGIYFAAEQKTYAHLFRLNPATKAIEKLSAPDHLSSFSFSFSQDYKVAAYRAALENQYAEIYSSKVAPWEGKRLTAMGDQLKGFTLARREVISWKSADGTTIEGVVYKPANFDAGKK